VGTYYFTVASLPYLTSHTHPGLSNEEFVTYLSDKITPAELERITACSLIPQSYSQEDLVVSKWNAFETSLRNQLALLRSKKQDLTYEGGHESVLFGLEEKAREAVNLTNPLEAEEFLDDIRWAYLEDLELTHYFDLPRLQIYYLKLQILNRKFLFKKEKGKVNFEKTYNEIRTNLAIEI